jgi:hypothetical protein
VSVRRQPSIVLALAALALSSCGDDDSSPAAGGPASFAPPGSPIYIEATVDPTEEQRAEIEELLDRVGSVPLLGSQLDPGDLVDQAFDEISAETGEEISFEADVEPWLGERAGLAVGSLDQAEEDGVFAVETTDEEAARDTLDRVLGSEEGTEEREYDGVDYLVNRDGDAAAGVFDGFAVLAGADEFEAVVDAARGDSLGDEDGFADAFSGLDEDALARIYLNFADVPDEQIANDPDDDPSDIAAAREVLPELFEAPIAATLEPSSEGVALDVAIEAEGIDALEQSALFGDAPADAVVALGLDDTGALVNAVIERVEMAGEELGEPSLREGAIASAFEAQFGLSLDDALAEFGDAVAYFRGPSDDGGTAALEFALNEDTGDETTSAPLQLLTQLGDLLESGGYRMGPPADRDAAGFSAVRATPDSGPLATVNAEVAGDRMTVTYTSPPDAASEPPDETLDSTEAFGRALAGLGDEFEPLLFADPGAILAAFVESSSVLDVVTGDAAPEDAVLDFLAGNLAYTIAGTRVDDGRLITRLVVGVD